MDDKARNIVTRLVESLDSPYHGSSSFTPAIYDTAWVSMVFKEETRDGVTTSRWLFPECFQTVLASQAPNGSFGANETQVDGILNTMAALLALCKHQKNPSILGCPGTPPDLSQRIEKAVVYLNQALQNWDVRSSVQVGFEILVPSLLRKIQEEEKLSIHFPGSKYLMALNRRKIDKISSDVFCTEHKTTLLHSLECFIGDVDFDQMSRSLVNGSMMGSPSSTAAYLMHSSAWDEDAEKYLRFVVAASKRGVPSAFPTSVFELSWVLSTLIGSGFDAEVLGSEKISKLADYLQLQLEANDGVTGFAPGTLADADDTAKSIYSLSLLSRPTNCEAMLKAFEGPSHFKTYSLETKESFSTNCNVLIALLGSESPSKYASQISKALNYLRNTWYQGKWSDKWNVEPQYSMMLFADALLLVLKLWDDESVEGLDAELITDCVPLITLQILVRTLSAQSESGSWKGSAEITAYALLTLKDLSSLPWARIAMGSKVDESIDLGAKYLKTNESSWNEPSIIWVEKVMYGSSILAETYCLASLNANPGNPGWGEKVSSLCKVPTTRLDGFCKFFSGLPLFSQEPEWRIQASIVEGYVIAPALQRAALEVEILPQRQGKYLEYIPFTWTLSNNAAGFGLSTQVLFEMMLISILNFQVDKWFEEITEDRRLQGDFEALKLVIRHLSDGSAKDLDIDIRLEGRDKRRKLPSGAFRSVTGSDLKMALLHDFDRTLSHFVGYVLGKVSATAPSASVWRRVQQELCTFLLAHVTQGEDNWRLARSDRKQHTPQVITYGKTYYKWVHTTSADHTSCPYSFEFFRCLILSSVGDGVDCFSGPRAQYLAQDVCSHLATMCRQYNDYGSIARDLEENNLNSVNFPEFHCDQLEVEHTDGQPEDKARRTLLEIANYERECLDLAMNRLRPEITARARKALKVFVDVTDLYGQIYMVRDINSSDGKK